MAVKTDRVVRDSFTGEFRFLSNFYPAVVEYDGFLYSTVEHAYQAAKSLDLEERELIRGAKTPGDAKRFGKNVQVRSDWPEIKVWIMQQLLRQKFTNPDMKRKLLETGDAWLIEGNTWGDEFWGIDTRTGKGKNMLGEILMDVRNGLQNSTKPDLEQSMGNPTALHGYMTTYTGVKFYPTHPNPKDVNIFDIAHSLSRFSRWGGHLHYPFSVAQHSVMVSEICNVDDALNGLMHDSPECYLGDMIRPLKYLPEMAIYREIESKVAACIAKAFNLETIEKSPSVEVADAIMLAREFIHLRNKHTVPPWAYDTLRKFNIDPETDPWEIWEPDVARQRFLNRFDYLTGKKQDG